MTRPEEKPIAELQPAPKQFDYELRAMEAAYLVLKGMPREQWGRALTYLARRLSSDDRGVHLNMNIDDFPEPTAWAFEGDFYTTATSDDEVLMNHGEGLLTVVEVTGIAVVSRKFGVAVAICDDDGGVEGHEPMWFATRETAEAFVAELKAGPDALGEDAT